MVGRPRLALACALAAIAAPAAGKKVAQPNPPAHIIETEQPDGRIRFRIRNSGDRDIGCTISFSRGTSLSVARIPPAAAVGMTLARGVRVTEWTCR